FSFAESPIAVCSAPEVRSTTSATCSLTRPTVPDNVEEAPSASDFVATPGSDLAGSDFGESEASDSLSCLSLDSSAFASDDPSVFDDWSLFASSVASSVASSFRESDLVSSDPASSSDPYVASSSLSDVVSSDVASSSPDVLSSSDLASSFESDFSDPPSSPSDESSPATAATRSPTA